MFAWCIRKVCLTGYVKSAFTHTFSDSLPDKKVTTVADRFVFMCAKMTKCPLCPHKIKVIYYLQQVGCPVPYNTMCNIHFAVTATQFASSWSAAPVWSDPCSITWPLPPWQRHSGETFTEQNKILTKMVQTTEAIHLLTPWQLLYKTCASGTVWHMS